MTAPPLNVRDVCMDDAEALAHIFITAHNATFRGRIPDQCLTLTEPQSAANWRRTLTSGIPPGDILVVAEPPGELPIGYAWAGPQRDSSCPGELRQLHVLPSHQRRGIGRLLVSHVAGQLATNGIHQLCVGVLKANPNRAFYEHLGARYLTERDIDEDGVVLREMVYRWEQMPVQPPDPI